MPLLFKRKTILIYACLIPALLNLKNAQGQKKVSLSNKNIVLEWQNKEHGYELTKLSAYAGKQLKQFGKPSGQYTILFSKNLPDTTIDISNKKWLSFPEKEYIFIERSWKEALRPVPMNTAGTPIHFFPERLVQSSSSRLVFLQETKQATVQTSWSLDSLYANDIIVQIKIVAKEAGFFSIQTPSLATVSENEIAWATVPGYVNGAKLEHNLVLSYGYGHGLPDRPVLYRERTAATLASIITAKNGLTLCVTPQPGIARDPWEYNRNTHRDWQLGLSLMNRQAALTPTCYHPVLGEKNSYLEKGEARIFTFRYTLQNANWYEVMKHVVNVSYQFKEQLLLKKSKLSLTNRILNMEQYLQNDSTSKWRVMEFKGRKIGAQFYGGRVIGANKDAYKNADYGAMWMMAYITDDTVFKNTRLPYARNFKLAQQQTEDGFFKGAALGQYYLENSKRFVEEWGEYVEPIALTYYTLIDMGNILLFSPQDEELKQRFAMGAERLLQWQYPDGHWEVAYDRHTHTPLFTNVKDLRPTFYGLLVAYKILGDSAYLKAACKGADWFIKNAVENGYFLGVCGDARFVPDFATGQSAQALLDLFEVTQNQQYRKAAIEVARLYTTSIYTHPTPDTSVKIVNGVTRQSWEITQAGLSFEHGGILGSANGEGPILLASHAGMFLRMSQITNDTFFANMARAAAWGRDAFVDSATSVATYYWRAMNRSPSSFPHHAWWQIGWITDYLISEIALRSNSKIIFPRGFLTPKVGPHESYGFAPGTIYDKQAYLYLPPKFITIDNPHIDYLCAINKQEKQLYVFLLNNSVWTQHFRLKFNADEFIGKNKKLKHIQFIEPKGNMQKEIPFQNIEENLSEYGLLTLRINYE
jgi:hypothetical protein